MQELAVIDGLNCAAMDRAQMRSTLAGGVFAINYTAVSPFADLASSLVEFEKKMKAIQAMSDICSVVMGVADAQQAQKEGKVGVILGTQNSQMVEDNLELLSLFKRLGFRILQPTYNERNKLGCGAAFLGDDDSGMTERGREWLDEMHRLQLIVDLSHCGFKTGLDFARAAKGPITVSHANAYEICKSPRNKTDEMIRAVADTGGLSGAVMYSPAVKWETRPTMDDYLNHLDHLVNVGGVEHTSFASDVSEGVVEDPEEWRKSYGPDGFYPAISGNMGDWFTYEDRHNLDYDSLSNTPRIWDGMRKRGYSETDIEKVMRGNWIRVMKDVFGE